MKRTAMLFIVLALYFAAWGLLHSAIERQPVEPEPVCINPLEVESYSDPSRGVTETMYRCEDGKLLFNSMPLGKGEGK